MMRVLSSSSWISLTIPSYCYQYLQPSLSLHLLAMPVICPISSTSKTWCKLFIWTNISQFSSKKINIRKCLIRLWRRPSFRRKIPNLLKCQYWEQKFEHPCSKITQCILLRSNLLLIKFEKFILDLRICFGSSRSSKIKKSN